MWLLRTRSLGPISVLLFSSTALLAGTSGTFRGTIVSPPEGDKKPGWIYVQGQNGNLRRAEITNARIFYSTDVPLRSRHKQPRQGLKRGTEVRVTAQQDGNGEWRAESVEILKKPGKMVHRRQPPPPEESEDPEFDPVHPKPWPTKT